MFRVIAALFALGLGAIAWVLLLPEPSKKPHLVAATAVTPADAATPPVAEPVQASREIRVVYPGPDGNSQVRKLSDKVTASANTIPAATPAPTTPDPLPTAAANVPVAIPPTPASPAVNATSTVVATAAEASAATPASTNPKALNINTASVEALNQIPGAGRIGRTIASHRPYRSVDELLSKRVVRRSVYEAIKSQIAAN